MSVIISPNLTINSQPGDIANRPRILVDNVFQQGTVTASSEVGADNGWLENAVDGGTYDWWEWSALPATLEVTLSTAYPVDMCAIGLHTGLTFVFQYYDGADWVDLHEAVQTTTTAVHAVIFTEVTASRFRISITEAADLSILGIVMLGKSIQLPKTFYGGHAPINLNRTTQIVRNKTENGFDAGVYSLRTGAATSVQIDNMKPSWIRNNLEALNKELEIKPFVFAWRPSTFPNDVAYCWLNSPIKAVNSGPRDYMTLSFDIQAFVGGGVVGWPLPDPIYVAVSLGDGIGTTQTRMYIFDSLTNTPTIRNYVATYSGNGSGFERVIKVSNGNLVVASRLGLILYSTDNGVTLTAAVTTATNIHFWAAEQSTTGTIIVAGGAGGATPFGYNRRIYRSTDNGVSYTLVKSDGLAAIYSVATDNAGTWCAIGYGQKMYVSTDDGITWTDLTAGQSGLTGVDNCLIKWDSTNSVFIIVQESTGGKIMRVRTTPNGYSSVEVNSGVTAGGTTSQFDFNDEYLFVAAPTLSTVVGNINGLYRVARDYSGSFTKVLEGDETVAGRPAGVKCFGSSVYAFSQQLVYRSDDNGDTWELVRTLTDDFANAANQGRRAN
jgi:hypothetical protein